MPIVRLPDGKQVKFPDDMPTEEIRALIEHKFPQAAASRVAKKSATAGGATAAVKLDDEGHIVPMNPMAAAPTAADAPKPAGDLGGQVISGMHEGVASTLSFPNQVARAFESIGPDIVNQFGGHVALPPADAHLPDAGKAYEDLGNQTGFIHPESTDPTEQFGRKVGQYVGGVILPAVGPVSEAATAAKLAQVTLKNGVKPAAAALTSNAKAMGSNALRATGVAAKEGIAATGAGVGAATANALAPNNPLAETAGAVLGGTASLGTMRGARVSKEATAAPTIESLQTDSGKLYDTAEARGVVASPAQTKSLASDMQSVARSEEIISPTGRYNSSYPRIVEAVKTFDDYASSGAPITVKQLQAIRQKLTDAAGSSEPGEQRIAMKMLKKFDAFTDPLAPELQQANAIYHRAMNAKRIETQINLAHSDAGDLTGSGFENSLRRRFQELERGIEKGDIIGFSSDEVDAIKKVAHGGAAQAITRWMGKFAPTGVVSAGMSGGVAYGLASALGLPALPIAAAVTGAGIGGRAIATAIRGGNAKVASALSRRGVRPGGPSLTPTEATAAGGIINTAANENSTGPSISMARLRNVGGAALQATH